MPLEGQKIGGIAIEFRSEQGQEPSLTAQPVLSIIVFNGPSCSSDWTQDWNTAAFTWLHDGILKDYPGAPLIYLGSYSEHPRDCDRQLDVDGNGIYDLLKDRPQYAMSTRLILCRPIGGLTFLKFLRRICKDNASFLDGSIICFFGTPLNDKDPKRLRKKIKQCYEIEFGLAKAKSIEGFDKLTRNLVEGELPLLKGHGRTFFIHEERNPSSIFGRVTKELRNTREGYIVTADMAPSLTVQCIALDKKHGDITKLNVKDYERVVEKLGLPESSHPGATAAVQESTASPGTSISHGKLPVIGPSPSIRESSFLSDPNLGQTPSNLAIDPPGPEEHYPIFLPIVSSKGKEKRPLAQVPCHFSPVVQNANFVGRKQYLKAIDEHFLPGNLASRESYVRTPGYAIYGPPGRGKTQTAAAYMYSKRLYYKASLWVSADTEIKLLEGLSEFAKQLGLIDTVTDARRDSRILIDWFSETEIPWLLVLDNAEDPNRIMEYWVHYSKRGAILLTTRHAEFTTPSRAGSGSLLPVLDSDSAIEMLRTQVPRLNESFDTKAAQDIVKRYDYLPLAIQLAIGLIGEAQCSLTEYLEQWGRPKDLILHTEVKHHQHNFAAYPQHIQEVYVKLVSKLSEISRAMIEIFSLLDPDSIDTSKLLSGVSSTDTDILKTMRRNRLQYQTEMLSKGLISPVAQANSTGVSSVSIHRLLQAWLQHDMSADAFQAAFSNAVRILAMNMTHVWASDAVKVRQEFKSFFSHVQAINTLYQEVKKEGKSLAIPREFIEMIHKASSLAYRLNTFTPALKLLRTAEEILGSNPEKNIEGNEALLTIDEIECCYSHACISTEVGDFTKSLEFFEKGIDLIAGLRKLPDTKHLWTADEMYSALLGGVANSLNGLGRNEEAEVRYRECLELAVDEWSIYEVNLYRCKWAQGQFEEASLGLESFLDRRREAFGPDDTKNWFTGSALYILGNVRVSQGNLQDAFDLHRRALDCWTKTFGPDHHKTGDANHKVGWHMRLKGKEAPSKGWTKQALERLDEALRIYNSGSDMSYRSGEIARTTYQKGLVLDDLGDHENAKTCYTKASQVLRNAPGRVNLPLQESDFEQLVSPWAR